MMHLIHRNRVDCSRLDRLERSPLRSNLLANIFPSGARLSSRIRLVRLTVTTKTIFISVLLLLNDEGN